MYEPKRSLRFSSNPLLVRSSSSIKSYGGRDLEISVSKINVNLPDNIKNAKTIVQLKSSVKTNLYKISYM